jgi:hypothetical protein
MRPVFNFLYLLFSYGVCAGSVYFAFYEKEILWARAVAYALGAVAAILIFGGGRFVKDEYSETRFSSRMSRISLILLLFGLVVALFGLWVFDLKLIGNVTLSVVGWGAGFLGLFLGALGKLFRELHNRNIQ